MMCLFCRTPVFSHLREVFQCELRGFSITLGLFINRTAGVQLPDLQPPPAVYVCVSVMAPHGTQSELWWKWTTPRWLWWTKSTFCFIFGGKACLCCWSLKVSFFYLLPLSSEKRPSLDWQRLSYCIIRPGF